MRCNLENGCLSFERRRHDDADGHSCSHPFFLDSLAHLPFLHSVRQVRQAGKNQGRNKQQQQPLLGLLHYQGVEGKFILRVAIQQLKIKYLFGLKAEYRLWKGQGEKLYI